MTKLSTYIPLEYIKQKDILTRLEMGFWNVKNPSGNWSIYKTPVLEVPDVYWGKNTEKYPAWTIADIIDNAEMLFGKEMLCERCGGNNCNCRLTQDRKAYIVKQNMILWRCQQNKSIEEISEYIINNIKI